MVGAAVIALFTSNFLIAIVSFDLIVGFYKKEFSR